MAANNTNNQYQGERNSTGEKHGKGILTFNTKAHYKGDWIRDRMEGLGEYVWGDGHTYVGEFSNNKQDGVGTYQWPTGGKYVGYWKEDRMNGFGTYTRNDGVIYIGFWKEDHQYGMGLKIIPARYRYGDEEKMYRKRKFREVWSLEKKLIFHKEMKEYPDLLLVQERKKFIDVVILISERTEAPTLKVEDITKMDKIDSEADEKTKTRIPALSIDSL
ncbi:phosphatidylinositol 4-phosphate 5-kinase [Acrasis kona]|uniref:Phosphatidylinositol 4-phosphate 5-kinase n=1 Tax=Acrasis kona TaxID=1008807 RepID=A0AAW2Z808_9EUKA